MLIAKFWDGGTMVKVEVECGLVRITENGKVITLTVEGLTDIVDAVKQYLESAD